jgi:hypothetical protein
VDDADPLVRASARRLVENSVADVFGLLRRDVRQIGAVRIRTSGKHTYDPIVEVGFYEYAPTDNDIKRLEGLPHLRRLSVSRGWNLTDRALRAIGSLGSLSYLRVYAAPFTDRGLLHLTGLQRLSEISLSNSRVSGEGLACLPCPSELVSLHLVSARVNDKSMKVLERFTNLRRLSVGGPDLGDEGMRSLKCFPGLDLLMVGNLARLTDKGLEHVKGLKGLRLFLVTGTFSKKKQDEVVRALPLLLFPEAATFNSR